MKNFFVLSMTIALLALLAFSSVAFADRMLNVDETIESWRDDGKGRFKFEDSKKTLRAIVPECTGATKAEVRAIGKELAYGKEKVKKGDEGFVQRLEKKFESDINKFKDDLVGKDGQDGPITEIGKNVNVIKTVTGESNAKLDKLVKEGGFLDQLSVQVENGIEEIKIWLTIAVFSIVMVVVLQFLILLRDIKKSQSA